MAQDEEVQTQEPHDLKGGGQDEKEPQTIQEQEHVETIPTTQVELSKIQLLEVDSQIELVEEEIKTVDPKVGGCRTTSCYTS